MAQVSYTDSDVDSPVAIIEGDHTLKKLAIDLPGMAGEGSAFVGYYDKTNNVKKLIARHFGEMGNTITTYYISENSLIFQKRISSNYDKPVYMNGRAVKSDSVSINCLRRKSNCDQSSFDRDISAFRKQFEMTITH